MCQEKGDFVQGTELRHGHLSPQGMQGERRAPVPDTLRERGPGHSQALLGCGGICHEAQWGEKVKNMNSHHTMMLVMPVAKKRFTIITNIITNNAKLLLPNILRQSTTRTLINRNIMETKSLEISLDTFHLGYNF